MRLTRGFLYLFSALLLASLWFSACIKDDLNRISLSNWKPALAIPLVQSTLKTSDFIKKFETGGYLTDDSLNNVVIVYESNYESPTAADLFPIQDIHLSFIDNHAAVSIPLPDDAILNTMTLSSGMLHYAFSATMQETLILEFTSPQASQNQEAFVHEVLVPFEGTTPMTASGSFDLAELMINYAADYKKRNTFHLLCKAYVAESGLEVESFDINAVITDLAFALMTGYFGAMEFGHHSNTMRLDIFDNWVSGTVFFDEPKIKINSWNSYGIPLFLSMDNLQGTNNQSAAIPLSGTLTNELTPLNYPDSTQMGSDLKTEIIADTSNSNITNVLAISPNQIDYMLSMKTNVYGSTNETQFVTGQSKTRFHLEMDIPLKGRIDHLVYQDTFNLDLGNIHRMDSAAFKLDALNAFPVSAAIQIYFADDDYQILDSLLNPPRNIISSGMTNESGQVILPVHETNFIPLGRDKIARLENSRKMIFRIYLLTDVEGTKTVRFTTDNALEIKLGALTQINLL